MTESELSRVALGRREYGNKIFVKIYVTGSSKIELMMLKDDHEFNWQNHTATRTPNIPGGILQPCSPDCDCFKNILYPINLDE